MKSTDEFSPGLIVEHKLFRHPGTFSSVHCALQIVVLSLWMVVTCQVKGHDLVRRNVGSIGCRTLLLPPPSAWILIPALNCQVESGRVVTKETSNNYRRKKKRVLVSLFPQTFGPQYYAEFSYRIKLYDCVVGSLWWFSHVPVTNDKDRIWNNPWFYRCFHKIARAAIGFVTSVCLSVCPHGTSRLALDGFLSNLICEHFSKICREIWSSIKIWQEYRILYAKIIDSDGSFRENQNKMFFQKFCPPNLVPFMG